MKEKEWQKENRNDNHTEKRKATTKTKLIRWGGQAERIRLKTGKFNNYIS